MAFTGLPARPLIGFLGVHPANADLGRSQLDRMSNTLAGLYVQFSVVNPNSDSASRLETLARFLLDCETLGVHGAEAGLGESERFALVLLVEQHVGLALEVADRALVLVHGRVSLDGTAVDLRADSALVEAAYFSGTSAE